MSEVKKVFRIALDVKKAVSNRDIQLVEGDTGNVLEIALTDGGEPVSLTDCFVAAVFSKSNGTAMQDSQSAAGGVSIGGADNNIVSIDLFTTSFSAGVVECELCVYSGADNNTLITSAKFNFKVRRSIINDATIEAAQEYPLLIELINRVMAAERHANALLPEHAHGELSFAGRLDISAAALAENDASSALVGRMAVAGESGALVAVSAGAARTLMGVGKKALKTIAIIPSTAWQHDTTCTGMYPYYADIPVTGATASMVSLVAFDNAVASSGIVSPMSAIARTNYVRVRASSVYSGNVNVTAAVWEI